MQVSVLITIAEESDLVRGLSGLNSTLIVAGVITAGIGSRLVARISLC